MNYKKINHESVSALTDYVSRSAWKISSLVQELETKTSKLDKVNQQLKELKEANQKEIASLKSQHAEAMNDAISATETRLNATINESHTKFQEAETRNKAELDALRNDYEQKLQVQTDKYQTELDLQGNDYKSKIAELTKNYEEQIAALTQKVDRLTVSNDAMIRRIRGLE